jgi:hypothetical protein
MTVGLKGADVASMKSQSAGQHWFVLLDGKRHGPFTYAELTRAARDGVITAETNIWRPGWQKWHPARRVKGLVNERAPVNERPVNETPLAPDGSEWAVEQVGAPAEETLQYAPPQQRRGEARRSQDVVALRREQRPVEPGAEIFADEWRMLAERPAEERGNAAAKPPALARSARNTAVQPANLGMDIEDELDYLPSDHGDFSSGGSLGAGFLRLCKRAAIGVGAILVVAAGGWLVVGSGGLRSLKSPRAFVAAPGDLPVAVASLPAVIALQRNDPSAFEHFKKRYTDSAASVRDDEVMSLARAALRKSVKHLLAISSGDVLLEITETSLAYMQGLQASNPESCVALSDESKGARLTSNLARELPAVFGRDMAVLERIASINPHMSIAPMTGDEARPYLETVFTALRRQSVKSELLGRDRLEPSDFAPYCALVIAFYKAVLDLPQDDKVNLLRYLYAAAAVNADSDLTR